MTSIKQPAPITLTVSEGEGSRLDRWLRRHYPSLSQGILEKLLRQGKIRLDAKKVTSGTRLSLGQALTLPHDIASLVPLTPKATSDAQQVFSAEDKDFLESLIIWEDEEVLILNKPHGLAVQGGSKTERHIDGLLQNYSLQTKCRYRLVHRLDRDTSGVFVVAKTLDVASHLTTAFRQGDIKKTYWGIVTGIPTPQHGKIDVPLLKGGDGNREKVSVDLKHGKKALTHYKTLAKLIKPGLPKLSWLEMSPETGRTHQLRVHAAYIGHPIVGDGKYGGKQVTIFSRLLHLHARAISFPDLSGCMLTFTAPLASHMAETLAKYGVASE